MKDTIETVKRHYDKNAKTEWKRLQKSPFEFIFTTYMMDRYIKPGDTVLDIGGGPGRYSIYYAQKGCGVTLVDLSDGNIEFALKQAKKEGAHLRACAKNCLELDELKLGQFDHVFLMGPLYHLTEEADRTNAIKTALAHLKPGGNFYASFILLFAGVIYDLKNKGNIVRDLSNPAICTLFDCLKDKNEYTGPAFTTACFLHQAKIQEFMARFPLRQLHYFGQESFLAPLSDRILKRSKDEISAWTELGKRLIELPELLSYSEHAMYIGRKL